MQQTLLVWFGTVVVALFIVKEAIDMAARIEYAEGAFPWLPKLAANKKWHRILLLATMFFYGGTLYELLKEPTLCLPPTPNVGVLQIGEIVKENRDLEAQLAPLTEKEPIDSLRRKTLKLADEYYDFAITRQRGTKGRFIDKPTTQEDQKARADWDQYSRETYDLFFKLYRERFLQIIKEYNAKGIPTGFLENRASQSPLGFVERGGQWEGAPQVDELRQFRDLAYRVDAKGDPINF